MRRQVACVFLLLLFIAQYQAQDTTTPPTWYGDPKLCVVYPPPTPSPLPSPPLPKFPKQAEFSLERVEIKNVPLYNFTLPSEITVYQYIYDYDANSLIMVKNKNGFVDLEYFYYKELKKSTYARGDICGVSNIVTDSDMDGASAIQIKPGEWHIRPLNEFLLFSSDNPSRQVTPIYLGTGEERGIPVHRWQSCYINKTDYRTVRRIWSFAQDTVKLPGSTSDGYSIPIQAVISASYDFPNGTQVVEFDEIFSVHSFQPGILESSSQLAPPKGVFCAGGVGQQLVSLKDVGIEWPNHFSVRVESSTSRSPQWQRFHLRYDQGREGGSRRLRYDFMPTGSEDFESVIHDYTDNLTYTIDRRVGSCKITAGVDIPDVSPIRDPIRFFIKHEARIIFEPQPNAWQFNGYRPCRGNSILCTILTTSIDGFPVMVNPETGMTTGESWTVSNVEYGWSVRAPFAAASGDRPKEFDYPVSLYMRMYRFQDPTSPSLENLRTEDIEYEFYEMAHERYPDDFDTSLCYRSSNYDYLHLVFTLNINPGNAIESEKLSRRRLIIETFLALVNTMGIRYGRVTELDIEHETISNDVFVFFTLLGQTPIPGPTTTFNANEPTAAAARDILKQAIDGERFKFSIKLDDDSTATCQAKAQSLSSSKQYMSSHAVASTITKEQYTSGAQAAAIIVGLLIGLIVGIILVVVIQSIRNKTPLATAFSFSNPFLQIRSKSGTPDGVRTGISNSSSNT